MMKARKSITNIPKSLENKIKIANDNAKVIDAVQEESEISDDEFSSNNEELTESKEKV